MCKIRLYLNRAYLTTSRVLDVKKNLFLEILVFFSDNDRQLQSLSIILTD